MKIAENRNFQKRKRSARAGRGIVKRPGASQAYPGNLLLAVFLKGKRASRHRWTCQRSKKWITKVDPGNFVPYKNPDAWFSAISVSVHVKGCMMMFVHGISIFARSKRTLWPHILTSTPGPHTMLRYRIYRPADTGHFAACQPVYVYKI